MTQLVNPAMLKKIATGLNTARCEELSVLINAACERYGVTKFTQLDEFLANLFQESLELKHKTENMNYRAETMMKVWPSRFPTLESAKPYARNPEKLANLVYGGRMGNNQPGDGWRFRGGGFIGLTGREVYTKYSAYIGKETGEAADLVRSQDYYALDSAFWFFYVLKGLKGKAEANDFIGIVKSINGGTIGLKDRVFYMERIKGLGV